MEDMNSQCGSFTFRGRKIRGCMLTCNDHLCNGAASNGFTYSRAYEYLMDSSYSQENSLLKIILGVKVCRFYATFIKDSLKCIDQVDHLKLY